PTSADYILRLRASFRFHPHIYHLFRDDGTRHHTPFPLCLRRPPSRTLFAYATLFRSSPATRSNSRRDNHPHNLRNLRFPLPYPLPSRDPQTRRRILRPPTTWNRRFRRFPQMSGSGRGPAYPFARGAERTGRGVAMSHASARPPRPGQTHGETTIPIICAICGSLCRTLPAPFDTTAWS